MATPLLLPLRRLASSMASTATAMPGASAVAFRLAVVSFTINNSTKRRPGCRRRRPPLEMTTRRVSSGRLSSSPWIASRPPRKSQRPSRRTLASMRTSAAIPSSRARPSTREIVLGLQAGLDPLVNWAGDAVIDTALDTIGRLGVAIGSKVHRASFGRLSAEESDDVALDGRESHGQAGAAADSRITRGVEGADAPGPRDW